jgi:hypothetical protein
VLLIVAASREGGWLCLVPVTKQGGCELFVVERTALVVRLVILDEALPDGFQFGRRLVVHCGAPCLYKPCSSVPNVLPVLNLC